uniref:BZIP domain-containing protein n=1 Tax=Trieres chinensis TaxID=1514140 RepID=A0A7S2EXE7_TRICV|mmetsp:Transcript_5561/g.11585  ORF Transcript_5561/g.11585 Transcript_5561/m.11585 type:complete len:150 (+) Transcript_5561:65-514(+)
MPVADEASPKEDGGKKRLLSEEERLDRRRASNRKSAMKNRYHKLLYMEELQSREKTLGSSVDSLEKENKNLHQVLQFLERGGSWRAAEQVMQDNFSSRSSSDFSNAAGIINSLPLHATTSTPQNQHASDLPATTSQNLFVAKNGSIPKR